MALRRLREIATTSRAFPRLRCADRDSFGNDGFGFYETVRRELFDSIDTLQIAGGSGAGPSWHGTVRRTEH